MDYLGLLEEIQYRRAQSRKMSVRGNKTKQQNQNQNQTRNKQETNKQTKTTSVYLRQNSLQSPRGRGKERQVVNLKGASVKRYNHMNCEGTKLLYPCRDILMLYDKCSNEVEGMKESGCYLYLFLLCCFKQTLDDR